MYNLNVTRDLCLSFTKSAAPLTLSSNVTAALDGWQSLWFEFLRVAGPSRLFGGRVVTICRLQAGAQTFERISTVRTVYKLFHVKRMFHVEHFVQGRWTSLHRDDLQVWVP